jgi:hypothetical protein
MFLEKTIKEKEAVEFEEVIENEVEEEDNEMEEVDDFEPITYKFLASFDIYEFQEYCYTQKKLAKPTIIFV